MADGTVLHPDRFKQSILFHGLRFGNKCPTDIDCVFEFQDKLFIFVEAKHKDTPTKIGQKLALERIVDALGATRIAVALIVEHETPVDMDVDISSALVREFRFKRVWRQPKTYLTLRQAIQDLADKYKICL